MAVAPTDKLVFVHVPKAGGTSTRFLLRQWYGEALLDDYADDPALPNGRVVIDPDGFFAEDRIWPTGIACIYGHFPARKYAAVENATWFTILREPVSLIESIYFYWKSHEPGGLLHQYFLRENLNILGLARLPLLRWLQSRSYFGGFDMGRFDFIGRHTARDASLAAIAARLGRPPSEDVRENETPFFQERGELRADTRLQAALLDILADDIEFYRQHAFRHIASVGEE